MRPPPDIAATPKTLDKENKIFSDDPLPLDALKSVDASVEVHVGQLLLPQLALHNLTFDLQLKDRRLTVKPLSAVIGGGTLDGHLSLHPRKHGVALAAVVQVTRFDVGRMLKDLDSPHAVEGQLDIDVKVKGRGNTVAGVMAGLNGSASV
ncbi:MAG: AsmA family protein, partial [Candidatus Tectomicrobia bacterium]